MDKRPHVTVGAFVTNQDGDFLLINSPKWGNKWVVPGGHVEYGETLIQAVQRELKEETNLTATNWQFIGYQDSIEDPQYNNTKHMIFMDFSAQVSSEKHTIKLNNEANTYNWFSSDQILNEISTVPSVQKTIKRYQQKNN